MYDIFYIGNIPPLNFPTAQCVDNFEHAQKLAMTKMFWLVWPDLDPNFDFKYKADKWSQDVTHVFKNKNFYDGICLFPKEVKITQKEIENRSFHSKKEVDIDASTPKPFEVLHCSSYDDYIKQKETITSDFFYVVPKDVDICNDFAFNYQLPVWEKDTSVIFTFNNKDYNDGVFLQHKSLKLARREFEFCWFPKTKELDVQASTPKPYDIVFISYREPNAEQNWKELKERFPRAKRVHGVKGIHQAHIEAAKLCNTDMIWIVDGDAIIVEEFKFDYRVPKWKKDQVFVWRSQNPINDMVYGYGGVKLFPRKETLNMDTSKPDMTTSISSKFNAVKEISNITAFNTGAFETWKSAFRECCKLSSKVIDRQKDDETNKRLSTWCSVGEDRLYGKYAIAGAKLGAAYGARNKGDIEALKKINDFDWMQEQFDATNI